MVDVRYWPLADNPPPLALVRYWTKADMRPVPYGEVHMVALEAFRWGLDRSGSMEYASMRSPKKRGEGHRNIPKVAGRTWVSGTVTIHRAGRTAELPLVGASHNLDPRSVRQVCEAANSVGGLFQYF